MSSRAPVLLVLPLLLLLAPPARAQGGAQDELAQCKDASEGTPCVTPSQEPGVCGWVELALNAQTASAPVLFCLPPEEYEFQKQERDWEKLVRFWQVIGVVALVGIPVAVVARRRARARKAP